MPPATRMLSREVAELIDVESPQNQIASASDTIGPAIATRNSTPAERGSSSTWATPPKKKSVMLPTASCSAAR